MLKYDSAQGRFDAEIKATEDAIVVNGDVLKIYAQKDPSQIPWASHDVDVVLECTGFFTDKDKASAHLKAGAKRVVISAPATGDLKTVVFNVNHNILDGSETIISCASCTTNCLAPMAKVLQEKFGIAAGFMTTIHPYTNDQNTLDAPHAKGDLRRARAAAANIVPNSTGAAKAIGARLWPNHNCSMRPLGALVKRYLWRLSICYREPRNAGWLPTETRVKTRVKRVDVQRSPLRQWHYSGVDC